MKKNHAQALAALLTNDSRLKKSAIIELGRSGDSTVIEHLEWAAKKGDVSVSYFANKAIREIKTRLAAAARARQIEENESSIENDLESIMGEVANTFRHAVGIERNEKTACAVAETGACTPPYFRKGLRLKEWAKSDAENRDSSCGSDSDKINELFANGIAQRVILATLPILIAFAICVNPALIVSNPFFIFLSSIAIYKAVVFANSAE